MFQMPYKERGRCYKVFHKPSLTKQYFKAECDINGIIKRFNGSLGRDFLDTYQGFVDSSFGDATNAVNYQDAHALISQASEAFSALPAKVRERFNNDPARFLDFMGDSRNLAEMKSLGLVVSKLPDSPAG